jgi:hypothetical protein
MFNAQCELKENFDDEQIEPQSETRAFRDSQ